MKLKTITGVLTIAGIISLVLLLFLVQSKGPLVPSVLVKLSMINFSFVIFLAGLYILHTFCEHTSPRLRMLITFIGTTLAVLSIFVCFNVIPFITSWNWLVCGGILFIMLIQTQLLQWGQRNPNLVRFSTLLIILADVFLVFFFITKWTAPVLAMWINIAAVTSVALTFLGLVILMRHNEHFKAVE